jgi:Ca2+-binding RTX toxin-like protein
MLCETLESRQLLSASLNNSTGLLTVTDTGVKNDFIDIGVAGNQLYVAINNVITKFVTNKIKKIIATSTAGNDVIQLENSVTIAASLVAGSGNDSLYGGSGPTTLVGGAGQDHLITGSGATVATAGTGNTTFLVYPGAATLNGGAGLDTYQFISGISTIFCNSISSAASTTVINQPANGQPNALDFSRLVFFDTLVVNLNSDSPIATFGRRTVKTKTTGQAANFLTAIGGAGNTTITGNSGPDFLQGGSGKTVLIAGPGQDTLAAGSGPTTLIAGAGNDSLVGNSGVNDFVFGPVTVPGLSPTVTNFIPVASIDQVVPGTNANMLDFSSMPATVGVSVDLSSDTPLATYSGRTILSSEPGQARRFTTVLGGLGNDQIKGNNLPDSLVGGGGADTLIAGSGADTMVGGPGSTDYVFNPQAAVVTYTIDQKTPGDNALDFSSLPSADPVVVNLLSDTLASYPNVTVKDAHSGQWANFTMVTGGNGNDSITGNNAGDTIYDGIGNDTINGGTGADFIDIPMGTGNDLISGNGGGDIIIAADGNDTLYATNAADDPVLNGGVIYPAANAAIPAGTVPGAEIIGGAGNDSIVGSQGDDYLEGGSGSATIHGLGGSDFILGGTLPSLLFGDTGNSTLIGGPGADTIAGGSGVDSVDGGDGGNFIDKNLPDNASTAGPGVVLDTDTLTQDAIDADQTPPPDMDAAPVPTGDYPLLGAAGPGDSVNGGSGNTTIIGGAGDDTLIGGDGDSVIIAGSGNVALIAGDGDQTLQGGDGNDTMSGGEGQDSMTGGNGSDVFLNANGYSDTITGGNGLNIAQPDPTGTSFFSNIQAYFDPDTAPVEVEDVPATVASPQVLTPAVTLSPAFVSGGYLYVGTAGYTSQQVISFNEDASGNLAVYQQGIGTQSFPVADGITELVVSGGNGGDYIDMTNDRYASYVTTGVSNTTVYGGSGNDTIIGGSGNNSFIEKAGNNVIYGGGGSCVLTGGSGSDYINPNAYGVYQANTSYQTVITGGSGTEYLDLSYATDAMNVRLDKGYVSDPTGGALITLHNIHKVFAGSGADYMVGDSAGVDMLTAGSGSDTIFGIGAHDYLAGGPGSDYVFEDGTYGVLALKAQHNVTHLTTRYNAGTGKSTASVDSTDIVVALQHPTA